VFPEKESETGLEMESQTPWREAGPPSLKANSQLGPCLVSGYQMCLPGAQGVAILVGLGYFRFAEVPTWMLPLYHNLKTGRLRERDLLNL